MDVQSIQLINNYKKNLGLSNCHSSNLCNCENINCADVFEGISLGLKKQGVVTTSQSPSFCGMFLNKDERTFVRNLFEPTLIYDKGKIFVNTSNPAEVLKILREKYFSYDEKYQYEILTKKNKKCLTNGQVDILNYILNDSNCVNIFNIKDFDVALKYKDKDFVVSCFDAKISPSKISQGKVEVFKYLNNQLDEDGDKKYSYLTLDDINCLNMDDIDYFDKVYRLRYSSDWLTNYDGYVDSAKQERIEFLNNKENGQKLLDFYSQNEINTKLLQFPLNKKIVSSKCVDDWLLILNKIIEREFIDEAVDERYESFSNLYMISNKKEFNPKNVATILRMSEDFGIEWNYNCIFDAKLPQKILKIKDKELLKFSIITGFVPNEMVVKDIKKLQKNRELKDSDYAVFEYVHKVGIDTKAIDIIENKPNLVEIISRLKNLEKIGKLAVDDIPAEYKENIKSFFLRDKDLSEEEKEVCEKFLRKDYYYSMLNTLSVLDKVGWLNKKFFNLNYNFMEKIRFLNREFSPETKKTVFEFNVAGFALNKFLKLGNFDEKLALSRLSSLKEISEINSQFVDKLVMNSNEYDKILEFIQASFDYGLNESIIEMGLKLNCNADDLEKLVYVAQKAPLLLDIAVNKKIKDLDLLYSYAKETMKPDESGLLYDEKIYSIALEKAISANNLFYIQDVLDKVPNVSLFHFVGIINVLDDDKMKKMSLKDYRRYPNYVTNLYNLMLDMYPKFKNSLLYKKINELGGIDKIVSTKLEEKFRGEKPLNPLISNAQGKLFNNLSYEKLLKTLSTVNFDSYKNGFDLEYSRIDLLEDLNVLLAEYSVQDVEKIKIIYNFDFDLSDGIIKPKDEKLQELSLAQKELCKKINVLLDKFLYENKIKVQNNKDLEQLLNSIVAFFPEFMSVIGKEQHLTHNYTVDTHTLKVLQACVKNPAYKDLSAKEKTILNIAVLLHDIGKKEGVVDDGHYKKSAQEMIAIFKKLKLDEHTKERIYNLILNHHWLGNLQKGLVSADEVAVNFRSPSDFKLAKIFAQADLKGVSDEFYNKCKDALNGPKIKEVEGHLSHIYKTGVPLFTNKINKKAHIPEINGVKVIDIANQPEIIPQVFGKSAKTRDDLRFLVHVFSLQENLNNMKILSQLDQDCTLSTSYISYKYKATYQHNKFGVFVDVPCFNVLLMNTKNMNSGYEKDKYSMIKFLNAYEEGCSAQREKQTEIIMKELNLTRNEYGELYKNLADCKSKTQIKDIKIGNRVLKKEEIIGAINVFEKSFFSFLHNEVVVYNPKMSGLIAMVDSFDEVPHYMKEFAKKYDLPIIILGGNTRY